MMTPRFMQALLSLCVGSVLTLGGNGALAAGDAADEPLPAMLSPGGGNPQPAATEPAPVTDSAPAPTTALPAMPPVTSPIISPATPSAITPAATPDLPALTTPPLSLPTPIGDQTATGYQPLASSVSVAQMGQTHGITLAGGQAQAGVILPCPAIRW